MGTKKKEGAENPNDWTPTVRQQKFIDYYEGNATEAAIKAGYSEKTAKSQGQRLLTNVDLFALIEKRLESEKSALIANRTEREEILSSILRNNKACEVSALTPGVQVGETPEGKTKFVKIEVVDKDKIKAIDVLNKMDAIYVSKQEHSGSIKSGVTLADGLKQIRDQMKSNPEEEERLLGEVINE